MEELSPSARLPADVEAAAQDPSRRWGPYIVVSELGRGANGVVNLAYDLRLHRRVALKTLLEMSPVQFERFAREARSAAKLEHPGIVRVLDLAMLNGRPYMAMEVVEGRSLRSCFREEALRTRELVAILRDVSEALGHAHAQGIVHRDVKPGNIFVDTTGRGRIMDFGVARDAGGDDLTTTGQALGTPEYMSPEQASDPRKTSAPSDVYSVGAVLFEGLTGRPPFLGSTPVETMFKVMSENLVRPSALSEVPMVLEEVILRCLDRDASKRYQDGRELARALDRFLAGRAGLLKGATVVDEVVKDEDEGSPGSARALIAIGIAIGLTVSTGLGWFLWKKWQDHQRELAALAAERVKNDERRLADEARRQADERKKQDEERKKLREAAFLATLRIRDPRQRLAKLDAHLEASPDDARALVARACARNDLHEDLAERAQPYAENDEAVKKDIEAALKLDQQCAGAYIERARLAYANRDQEGQNAALVAAEHTRVLPEAVFAEIAIRVQQRSEVPLARSEELVRDYPGYFYGWRLRAQELMRYRRYKDAAAAFGKSLELHESTWTNQERVNLLTQLLDWDAVIESCARWLDTWPGSPNAYFHRGRALMMKKDTAGALEDAKRLLDLNAAVRSLELSAQVRIGQAAYDEAIADCEALVKQPTITQRERSYGLYLKAMALTGKADLEGACDTLVEAAGVSEASDVLIAVVSEAYRVVTKLLQERGDADAADRFLRRLGDTRGRGPTLLLLRVRVALCAGDLGLARQLLGEAKQQAPNIRPDEERMLERCYTEANSSEGARRVQAGLARGDEAAKLDRALLIAATGERDRAKDEIERIMRDGTTPEVRARAHLAHARHIVSEREDSAAEDIEKALQLLPDDPIALSERAVLRARGRKEVAAREDSARAVALSPKDALVHARRAETCLILGDLEGASAGVKDALALDARCWDALSVRLHLDERRGDRAAQAADIRALLPFELYSARVETQKCRAAYLEKTAPEKSAPEKTAPDK